MEIRPNGTNRKNSRHDKIQNYIALRGSSSIEELVKITDVSRMTIHRDLDELEKKGALHRTRGGASVEKTLLFETSAERRLSLNATEKIAIAEFAATLVDPGQVIMLDDSSTSYYFLRSIPIDHPVTIISNFVPSLNLASSRPNTHTIALGGDYRPNYQAYLGILTEMTLERLHADVLVSSSSALRNRSLYHQSQEVISTRRAMMASSDRSLLLLDNSKIGHTALYQYGDVEEYDHIVVDDGIDEESAECLEGLSTSLHVITVEAAT